MKTKIKIIGIVLILLNLPLIIIHFYSSLSADNSLNQYLQETRLLENDPITIDKSEYTYIRQYILKEFTENSEYYDEYWIDFMALEEFLKPSIFEQKENETLFLIQSYHETIKKIIPTYFFYPYKNVYILTLNALLLFILLALKFKNARHQ